MEEYFAYIRVSTAKQGSAGVSLTEQKEAIERYAAQHQLEICQWFEERVTAAKRGRTIFTSMLLLLKRKKAAGVIFHKIDRSARNLKDWADLGTLVDEHGIEIHTAVERLDLHTRGGRLSADIQAIVAADYIRNLREETIKGFYGRLKQGLYPLPAPPGYLNNGKGKPKTPDPVRAPLVQAAFKLYASGQYGLHDLRHELADRGFRGPSQKPISLNGISKLVNNPFYAGLIRLTSTGETFPGIHEPLISMELFERCQAILNGRTPKRTQIHSYRYRRMFRCGLCGYSLIGELQRGHIYYRCQTKGCETKCIREEILSDKCGKAIAPIALSDAELDYLESLLTHSHSEVLKQQEASLQGMALTLKQLNDRQVRLTDALIDGLIDKPTFNERRRKLLTETTDLEQKRNQLAADADLVPNAVRKFLEQVRTLKQSYLLGNDEEKREALKICTSNMSVAGKYVAIELQNDFGYVADTRELIDGDPSRETPRSRHCVPKKHTQYLARLHDHLVNRFRKKQEASCDYVP